MHEGLRLSRAVIARRTILFPCSETSIFFGLPEERGLAFLDPKFAQEHDERISFGHRARVQQPAREGNQQPGRLPAGSPRVRTHPTKIPPRIHPDLRIQIVHALSQLDSCITALYTV